MQVSLPPVLEKSKPLLHILKFLGISEHYWSQVIENSNSTGLSNKVGITSYLITSRGRARIGYLAAHKDIQIPAFFPFLHSATTDYITLRLEIKMAVAITDITSRHDNSFLWFSAKNKKTFLGNPPRNSPNIPLARVGLCVP